MLPDAWASYEASFDCVMSRSPCAAIVRGCEGPKTCLIVEDNSTRSVFALTKSSRAAEDLREAVTTLEETEQTARRVLGAAHPLTGGMGESLQAARAKLRARETPSPGSA